MNNTKTFLFSIKNIGNMYMYIYIYRYRYRYVCVCACDRERERECIVCVSFDIQYFRVYYNFKILTPTKCKLIQTVE